MKIETLNINHGGRSKKINQLIKSLLSNNPDCIILTEYRNNLNGHLIITEMMGEGWLFNKFTHISENQNGILILSKYDFNFYNPPSNLISKHRWIEIKFKHINLNLLAVHIPGFKDSGDKKNFWETI